MDEKLIEQLVNGLAKSIIEEQDLKMMKALDTVLSDHGEFDPVIWNDVSGCRLVDHFLDEELMFSRIETRLKLFSKNIHGKYRLLGAWWSDEEETPHDVVDWFLKWHERMSQRMIELGAKVIGYDRYEFENHELARSCKRGEMTTLTKYVFRRSDQARLIMECVEPTPIDAVIALAKIHPEKVTSQMRDSVIEKGMKA